MMIKAIVDNNSEKEYPLFGGGSTTSKTIALQAKNAFTKDFITNWDDSVADQRMEMIRFVSELEPEEGLKLTILGLQDFSRKVRLEAKTSLKILAAKVTVSDENSKLLSREDAVNSELFSRVIFEEIQKTLSLDELRGYLSVLLTIGGRGPYFAWKFFLKNIIPQNVFIDILRRFPERLRLKFVYHYFFSEVTTRRKYLALIRLLLKDITECDTAADFIINIIEYQSDCRYANVTRAGSLLYEFMDRLNIATSVVSKGLKSENESDIIKSAKIAAIMNDSQGIHRFRSRLYSENSSSLKIALLEIISRSHAEKDRKIIDTVSELLSDEDTAVREEAFKTMIALNIPEIEIIAFQLIENNPSMRMRFYKCMASMKSEHLIRVLDKLPKQLAFDARRTIARELLKIKPERLTVLFGFYRTDSDDKTRLAAEKLFEGLENARKNENKDILKKLTPNTLLKKNDKKKVSGNKSLKKMKQIEARDSETLLDIGSEVFDEADLKGLKLKNVDLSGSSFYNTDMSSAHLTSTYFKKVRFENVNMQNAKFDKVCFDQCIFINVDAGSAQFNSCTFSDASVFESSFEFSEINGSYFTNAALVKTNFTRSDLSFSSFTGTQLALSNFSHVSFFQSEFYHTKGILCDYHGTDLNTAAVNEYSDLEFRSDHWNKIDIPSEFYEKKLLDTRWLNILILTNEMDRQREVFLKHNNRCKEHALDCFRAEQEDLFELVPLLIHLTQPILPIEQNTGDSFITENIMLKNEAAGIYGYTPTQRTVSLAKKYLKVDKLLLVPGKECHIEALFTIGSIGTIAQAADSDIDYWVCVDRTRMGEDAAQLLKLKLDSIEKWARVRFGTELHFFIVDPASVREDRFGGSDFESSGSAQGIILKEEFYRTMILVSGKIPFWCILPIWTDARYYRMLYTIAGRFYDDYLDLGNVSAIPSGEYFGASMWQLFKSLTSPYKSVMKMALLEKYIQEGKTGLLLCNRLKGRWSTGKYNFVRQDPYLLLFEEITDYYKRTNQEDIMSLVQLCFFLKLEIRSIKSLDKSVFKIRKLVVQKCIDSFKWDEEKLCDLGFFDEWSYERILNLSNRINRFMIETYRRLSGVLSESPDSEALITDQDLTILGRKMFVQFSSHPNKVKKLPHVARGRHLFKQLYIIYRQVPKKTPVWEVYPHYDKSALTQGNDSAILSDVEHIEEIAAWIILNGIYSSGTSFNILPNPTSVSAQDFNELLKDMNDFFTVDEGDSMPSETFLEQYKMYKLYIITNFSLSRKADKIFQYAAVYMTTWGEVFCRVYKSKKGLDSIPVTVEQVKVDLGLPFHGITIGCHVPKMARKRIQNNL